MGTFPASPRSAFITWCQAHSPTFSSHAAAIGLTPAQASAYAADTSATVSAVVAQEQARLDYKAATLAAESALAALRETNGEAVRLIRAFAESQTKPDVVYGLAQIDPPAPPSPAPPPAMPTNLTAALDATRGELTLRWKCANPGNSGTTYIVRRKMQGQSEFTFLGTSSGRKSFVDTTLTAGPDSVQYYVQGQRAGISGLPSGICTVNFGRTAGGQLTANVRAEGAEGGATAGNGYAAASGTTGAAGLNGSTVNGRGVQKVLPTVSGPARL